jgi:hypothetical protein
MKTRRRKTTKVKRRKNATAARRRRSSAADLQKQLDLRTHELAEALEQQTATSEILRVISSSPGELEPVFQAMLANATRLCEADFGILYQYDGNVFQPVALQDAVPALGDYLRREPPGSDTRHGLGRLLQTKQPIHISDVAAEPAYAEREPLRVATVEIAKARTLLAVPCPPPCRAQKIPDAGRDAPIDKKCNLDRRKMVVCCPELERVRPVIVRGSTAPPAQVHQ